MKEKEESPSKEGVVKVLDTGKRGFTLRMLMFLHAPQQRGPARSAWGSSSVQTLGVPGGGLWDVASAYGARAESPEVP